MSVLIVNKDILLVTILSREAGNTGPQRAGPELTQRAGNSLGMWEHVVGGEAGTQKQVKRKEREAHPGLR